MVDSGVGEPEEGRGTEHLDGVADQNDAAAVEAIGDVPAGQDEEQAGQEEGEAGIAEVKRAVRDLVDLPGDSDRLRFRSHDDEGPRALIEAEVAIGERCCSGTSGAITHTCIRV